MFVKPWPFLFLNSQFPQKGVRRIARGQVISHDPVVIFFEFFQGYDGPFSGAIRFWLLQKSQGQGVVLSSERIADPSAQRGQVPVE